MQADLPASREPSLYYGRFPSGRAVISLSAMALAFGVLLPAHADSLRPGIRPQVCDPAAASREAPLCRPEPRADGPSSCAAPPETPYDRQWDLSAWLTTHAEREALLGSLSTTQSGKRDPAPFAGTDWNVEVGQFRTAWQAMLGPIPKMDCVPLDPQFFDLNLTTAELAQIDWATYTMKRVTYRGAHGERITAFLLVPHHIVGKVPAVVVMHQSLLDCGKKEPVGVCQTGTPWLDFARDLAQQGYVTLAPDSVGFGERAQYSIVYGMEYADAAPLLSRFPSSSLLGLNISDIQRGIDFLQTLPYVDGARIGMLGHSNGAIATLFAAAFDSRIKCAVTNASPNLIRREIFSEFGLKPGISRWAGLAHIPSMGFYDKDISLLPVEMHQLYALIAPRGLFVSLMEDDSLAPRFDRIQFAMDQARRAFDNIGGDFAYHTIGTGLTPERHRDWAVPACMSVLYDACKNAEDPSCLKDFHAGSMDASCIAAHGSPLNCAYQLWQDCLAAPHTEAECRLRYTRLGITDACVEQSFQTHFRRDHGWYPETEALVYPWLESCLNR